MNKRLFDIVISLIALAVFSPILIVLPILIWLEDRENPFFVQTRLGQKLKPFSIIKFRSMHMDQITSIGRIIRNTGLDEILQFIIVLKGEMSVVGPRPLSKADTLRLGWYDSSTLRSQAKPGITGLSQLYAGRSKRVSYFLDNKYALNQSFVLDIKIIALSFAVNILGKKRVKSFMRRA